MCPVCIATAALIASGATSTGGLAALVVKLSGKVGAKKIGPKLQNRGERNEQSRNRVAS